MSAHKEPMSWLYFIILGIYIFVSLCVVLAYRTAGIAVLSQYVVIRRGMFGKTIEIIPYDKIQYINTKQGWLDRRLKLCHGTVSILASTASQTQGFGRFEEQELDNMVKNFRGSY